MIGVCEVRRTYLNSGLRAQISAYSTASEPWDANHLNEENEGLMPAWAVFSMKQSEMNSISLHAGEGPSLGAKDIKKSEAKLENIGFCPGLPL